MIQISFPIGFEEEKKYTIQVLFQEILNVPYHIEFSSKVSSVEMKVKGGEKKIAVEDAFFSGIEGTYLSKSNIPKSVEIFGSFGEFQPPVIYGRNTSTELNDTLYIGLDLIASAFFMLSRWEEVVIKERDQHGRFPAKKSLAFKNDFLQRPVVNEYAGILKDAIEWVGGDAPYKNSKAVIVPTHDIDSYRTWGSPKKLAGRLRYYYLSKKPFHWWLTFDIPSYIKTALGIEKDPYDTFDEIMSVSEEFKVQSIFMLMDYGKTSFDRYYKVTNKRIQELIKKIKKRGHLLGFHPSYAVFNHIKLFEKAYQEVKEFAGNYGRQHYLRFDPGTTWRVWDEAGMEWDSTVYYAESAGFRCGTCHPFTTFDVVKGKALKLKERPMAFMEQTFMFYEEDTPEEMKSKVDFLLKQVVKHKGEFVFLWHNATLNAPEHKLYKGVYRWVFERFTELNKRDVV